MNTMKATTVGPVRLSSKRSVATPVRAATMRPRAVRGSRLVVRAEKVVGIDLGTTNSAVRPQIRPAATVEAGLWQCHEQSCLGAPAPAGAFSRSRRGAMQPRSGNRTRTLRLLRLVLRIPNGRY